MAMQRTHHQHPMMPPPPQQHQPGYMANEPYTPLQPPLNKSQIRFTTWGQMAAHDIIVENAKHKFYSIPDFRGSAKAAFQLMRTDQFRNANKIYVDAQPNSRLLEQIVAFSGKDLFVPAARESGMACQVFRAVHAQHLPEILRSLEDTSTDSAPENTPARDAVETAFDIVSTYFTELPAHDMEELDMVIVGCVAVSPTLGHCVGRGYGHTDLQLAMLQHMGAVVARTVVATVVHEQQVLHHKQHQQHRHIFRACDFPVDLIVAPSFQHVVYARAPRPERLFWGRISRRRLASTPLLDVLYRQAAARLGAGRGAQRVMALKEEDSDVESSRIQRNPNLAKYHKNRGTADQLSGDELQAFNLVIFGRFADGGGPEALASGPAAVEAETLERAASAQMSSVETAGHSALQLQTPSQLQQPQLQALMQQPPPPVPQHLQPPAQQQLHQPLHPPSVHQQSSQSRHQTTHPQQQQQQQSASLPKMPPIISAELSKDQYRWLIWQRLQTYNAQIDPQTTVAASVAKENYQIPVCANIDAVAHRLAQTHEFRTAEHVMIFNHANTEAIGLSAVHHGKHLYVPSPENYVSAFTRVQPPPGLHTHGVLGPTYYSDNSGPTRKPGFLNVDNCGNGVPMPLDPIVQLDLVVVSALCAARNGRIIGTGRGHVDLLFGILLEAGAIAHWTKIVCIVDDVQLFDELPEHIFQRHDMPVDMLVTPTQCIPVLRPPKRPIGLMWRLLTKERILTNAVLYKLAQRAKRGGGSGAHGDPLRSGSALSDHSSSHYRDPATLAAAAANGETFEKSIVLPAQFINVPELRTAKLKQYENCVMFQFYELPPHMTRRELSGIIQTQLKRKPHYIKLSKRKCRAYVYFKDVDTHQIHDLYAGCSGLVIKNNMGQLYRFSVMSSDPIVYADDNQQPQTAVWLNSSSYGMPWSSDPKRTRPPPYGQHNLPALPVVKQSFAEDAAQMGQHQLPMAPNRLSHQAKPYVPRSRAAVSGAQHPAPIESQQQQQRQPAPEPEMEIGVWNPLQML